MPKSPELSKPSFEEAGLSVHYMDESVYQLDQEHPLPLEDIKTWNQKRIFEATLDVENNLERARRPMQALLTNIFKVRPNETGVIILDSASDLAAAVGIITVIQDYNLTHPKSPQRLNVMVLRDDQVEDLNESSRFLQQFINSTAVNIQSFNMFDKKEYENAIKTLYQQWNDWGICFTNASYDIRVNNVGPIVKMQCPMIMAPGMTLDGLASPMWDVDPRETKRISKNILHLHEHAVSVRVICPQDSTNFSYYLDNKLFEEALYDFSARRNEPPFIENPADDNAGPETYTVFNNMYQTHGELCVYWPDDAPFSKAYQRGQISKKDLLRMVSEQKNPLVFTYADGRIIRINCKDPLKLQIFRQYIAEETQKDPWSDAWSYAVEPGYGANPRARQPGQSPNILFKTIETEKSLHDHMGHGESYINVKHKSNIHLDHLFTTPPGGMLYKVLEQADGTFWLIAGPEGRFPYDAPDITQTYTIFPNIEAALAVIPPQR